MSDIETVLARRDDLATFVVHLTKANEAAGHSALDALKKIASNRRINASTRAGWYRDQPDLGVACFSEVPLQFVATLAEEIRGRQVQLEPYGIAFLKTGARKLGINPVWYIDKTPGRDWTLARALDSLTDECKEHPDGFSEHSAARILPFFEVMGTWDNRRREFWWEREWRSTKDVPVSIRSVALWFCPEYDIDDFRSYLSAEWNLDGYEDKEFEQHIVDPAWGLERIIAELIGRGPAPALG